MAVLFYLAGDREGGGGPFWDRVYNRLNKKHVNSYLFFLRVVFASWRFFFYLAGDGERRVTILGILYISLI